MVFHLLAQAVVDNLVLILCKSDDQKIFAKLTLDSTISYGRISGLESHI